ncbi:MAG TPA: hypothetical protein VFT43_00770 [Candidatus Polarisedimenticolia bacterium]|nr:hypothetical protein [Candidatus Polarisedimenticolia bacterium]
MKLNLSDEPVTAELLAESLRRAGSAILAVNGTSMHPTLQMGWRIYIAPARGEDLRIGEIAVFRGADYLTIHRLVWRERGPAGETLVFRGDYNRLRERVSPEAVIGRVKAVEVPGRRKGLEKVVALEGDVLTWFYRATYGLFVLVRPLLPAGRPTAPGRMGRLARSVFSGLERLLSIFLPGRR